jgi:hypothetical protein
MVLEFKMLHVGLAMVRLHRVQPNISILVVKCIMGVGYYLLSKGLSHAQWSSSKGWYEAYK